MTTHPDLLANLQAQRARQLREKEGTGLIFPEGVTGQARPRGGR